MGELKYGECAICHGNVATCSCRNLDTLRNPEPCPYGTVHTNERCYPCELDNSVKNLKEILSSKDAEIKELRERIEEYRKNIQGYIETNGLLKKDYAELKLENEGFRRIKIRNEILIEKLNTRITDLISETTELGQELLKMSYARDMFFDDCQKYEKEISTLKQSLAKQERNHSVLVEIILDGKNKDIEDRNIEILVLKNTIHELKKERLFKND